MGNEVEAWHLTGGEVRASSGIWLDLKELRQAVKAADAMGLPDNAEVVVARVTKDPFNANVLRFGELTISDSKRTEAVLDSEH